MFEMQIKIDGEWISIKKTNAKKPYQYDTWLEAERMLDICYPDQRREDRLDGANNQCQVVQVSDARPGAIKEQSKAVQSLVDAAAEAQDLYGDDELEDSQRNAKGDHSE